MTHTNTSLNSLTSHSSLNDLDIALRHIVIFEYFDP